MIDVVYITGGRSAWDNNELRYSIRSLCKYLTGMGNVFIVGTCPEWLAGVIHIPAEDDPIEKKEVRLYRKRLVACRDERISQVALFAYDDEYLLAPHDAETFPNYYEGTVAYYTKRLIGHRRKGHHRRCADNTVKLLGNDAKLFDIHCPMLVNREKFIEVMGCLDWEGNKDGYLIKSTYGSLMQVEGTECPDVQLSSPDAKLNEYKNMTTGVQKFTTGDNANFIDLTELMEELFPEKSVFEL